MVRPVIEGHPEIILVVGGALTNLAARHRFCLILFTEFCPMDTALFDDHCYWSNGDALPADAADDVCQARGGHLAAFPSQDAIDFTGQAW